MRKGIEERNQVSHRTSAKSALSQLFTFGKFPHPQGDWQCHVVLAKRRDCWDNDFIFFFPFFLPQITSTFIPPPPMPDGSGHRTGLQL